MIVCKFDSLISITQVLLTFALNRLTWSEGNTGKKGLRNFRDQHTCGKVCEFMGLVRLPKSQDGSEDEAERLYGNSAYQTHIPQGTQKY